MPHFSIAPGRRLRPPPAAPDIAVILGTERITDRGVLLTALVINADGTIAGFQDKGQLDPSEEGPYAFGDSRHVFTAGPITFGISICHEGWRYPGDRALAREARRADRVSPALSRSRTGQLPANDLRGSQEQFSREGRALPRRREHVLLCDGELRERRIADDVGNRQAGRRRCSLTSRTARTGCSSRISISMTRLACWRCAVRILAGVAAALFERHLARHRQQIAQRVLGHLRQPHEDDADTSRSNRSRSRFPARPRAAARDRRTRSERRACRPRRIRRSPCRP